MAKKSGNRLSYHFKPLSENLSFFYLHTVPTLEGTDDVAPDGQSDSLDQIMEVHKILNAEDVLMIFNGVFNPESYESLITSLEKNISENKDLKNRLFNTVAEMLQNIVKHGERTNINLNGNPGIFYISQLEDYYLITTGNYILHSYAEDINTFLTKLNSTPVADIDKNCKGAENKKLGLINIRKNTGNPITFSIKKVDDIHSFISLRVKLNPNN